MAMDDSENKRWQWMVMDGTGWIWMAKMALDGYGWIWMAMDGNGWHWMAMDDNGWQWMAMDGWKLVTMDGND